MVTGTTRSGKTSDVLQRTANDARLLVFDYSGRDWPAANCERVEGMAMLCDRIMLAADGPARISYRGHLDNKHFSTWASIALAWSQFAPLTVVAEELADVVHPGKAPGGWGELVRGGLAYGVTIYGITQRPQETDKSIFGNATTVRVFRTGHIDDAQYISRRTGIDAERINALNKLEYLEKDTDSGDITRGKVSFH